MPGFFYSNVHTNIKLNNRYPDKCFYESPITDGSSIALRGTLNKFMEDKAFFEDKDCIFILEGVIYNKTSLFKKYCEQTINGLLQRMYALRGCEFYNEFRGSFSGIIKEKETKKTIVFTNHIGDSPVYYLEQDGIFVVGSQINYLIDFCREKQINLTFNEDCAYQMLTYAFVPTDDTYAKEIKRLPAGRYLIYSNNKLQEYTYHSFVNNSQKNYSLNEEDLIEEIDNAFRNAVQLEWNKDKEYNLDHLADLSGGLDSRMNMWVAHDIEKRNATILTYCKKGYLDEKIAKEIAEYWGDRFIFSPLDDAAFMYDIDEITFLNGGLSLYSGITGGKRLLESIDPFIQILMMPRSLDLLECIQNV